MRKNSPRPAREHGWFLFAEITSLGWQSPVSLNPGLGGGSRAFEELEVGPVPTVRSAAEGLVQHQARKGRESLCGVRLAVGHVGECREQGAGGREHAPCNKGARIARGPRARRGDALCPGVEVSSLPALAVATPPHLLWSRPVPRSDRQANTVPCHPGLTGRARKLQLPGLLPSY